MSWREFAIELLRVLLGAPLLTAAVVVVVLLLFRGDIRALLKRIATLRFPGGELTTSQIQRTAVDEATPEKPPPPPDEPPNIPRNITLSPEDQARLAEFLKAEHARAALWEYRFLNLYLVPNTQRILDWLISLPQRTSLQMYDSFWQPAIPQPDERLAILSALQSHHLVEVNTGLIEVTPKGREYAAWRGPLQLPAA